MIAQEIYDYILKKYINTMIMIVILCCEKGSDIVITPIKPSLLNVFGVQMSKPPSLGKLKRIKEAQ